MIKNSLKLLAAGLLPMAYATSLYAQQGEAKKPNILFICIDDLRTELGCYGKGAISPNLDNLASQGSLFTNHYVQVPTSGASRNSLLTGYLPRHPHDTSNNASEINTTGKPEGERPETMFHQLRREGYYTVGIGKISHSADGRVYGYKDAVSDIYELPHSWDEMLFDSGKWATGWKAFFGYSDGESRITRNGAVKPYECAPCEDTGLPDGLTAELALKKMDQLAKNSDQPFCLSVGFFKPHLPFNSPKKYWDLYDESKIDVSDFDIPEGSEMAGLHDSFEFRSYKQGDEVPSLKNKVSDEYARKLRHAYLACISYTDAQVGKLLTKLDELGLSDNTIVVVWGDHGWNLGDMRVWGKHTLYEPSLRSTLIVKAPGKKANIKNSKIVSSVDIYPTLMDLCKINVNYQLDGKSFANLLNHPKDKSWEEISYAYFGGSMSMRTPKYRLIRFNSKSKGEQIGLYKYKGQDFERENIAAQNPEKVEELMELLRRGNKGIYPKF